jgi:hypothetical protein
MVDTASYMDCLGLSLSYAGLPVENRLSLSLKNSFTEKVGGIISAYFDIRY